MDMEGKNQVLSDYDGQDEGEVKPLPNFIPPEVRKTPAAAADESKGMEEAAAAEQSAAQAKIGDVPADMAAARAAAPQGDAELAPAMQQPEVVVITAQPEVAREVRERRNEQIEDAEFEEIVSESETKSGEARTKPGQGDTVTLMLDRATYEVLMGVAKKVNEGATLVDPEELQRVNAAVQQGTVAPGAGATQGQQQVRTGAQALAEGGMSLIGGAAALTGAALKAGGKVASSLAGALRGDSEVEAQASPAAGVAVLPRISEYRVDQAEKAANAYEDAMGKLWESGHLPNVRKEIEERARQTGLSVPDVLDKMKPNGEMADLHGKFCAAVGESPDAQTQKKAMDKALDGWVRQYGRGQEELLNPETEGNPHFEVLRDRLDGSHGRMQKNTANVPVFEGEEKSHAEKLRETVQRIMEKLKEIAKDFVNMVRGRKSADAEADNAPSP